MNVCISTQLTLFKLMDIVPNFSELAREYNIDRHTLKKHYLAGGIKPRKKREYSSELDNYKNIITDKLEIVGNTYKGIYLFLKQKKNIKCSYSNFTKYLKKEGLYKKKKSQTAHVRYETNPGKQLQVDWKEDITMISKNGEVFKFNLFAATLGYSRLHHFVYSETRTREAFIRCFLDTLYHIGGVTDEVLTDNMKSIITILKNEKNKCPELLQLEKDLSIKFKFCKVRTPETKGKVESSNRFISRLISYNNEFEDLNELLSIIDTLNKEINAETSQSTNISPILLFKKEKEYLHPIPSKCIFDNYILESKTIKVPNTMLVYHKGCEYSVPMKYINKRVKLIEIDNTLHIYYNTELIQIHQISKNKINYNKKDYEEALSYSIKNKDLDIKKIAEENLKLLGGNCE